MRTIVIGDVHGCLEELDELLARLAPRRGRDALVFVGDLVDRGPDPVGVVRRARELGAVVVMGNHDDKHVRWAKHEAKRVADPTYENPMKMGEETRRQHEALSDDDLDFLRAMPLHHRLGEVNGRPWAVVHAGLEPRKRVAAQKRHVLLRARYLDERGIFLSGALRPSEAEELGGVPWATRWPGPESIVYGHMVHALDEPRLDEPTDGVRCWGIDTGCCFGGRLTALVLPGEEIVQVEAKDTYAELLHADEL